MQPISFKFFFLFCLLLSSFACTNQVAKEPEIIVSIQEPTRIRFSGKGAGAGMMLSSSMGPMGIAIGVAIDEGIGKEIDETATAGGFSIESVLTRAFASSNHDLQITVKRYGFVLAKGDYPEDHVLPELDLQVQLNGAETLDLRYPPAAQGQTSPETLPSWHLDTVKTDADAVIGAFEMAAAQLASELPQHDPGN